MSKLSTKEINMREMLFKLQESLMIAKLQNEMPMIKMSDMVPMPMINDNLGWRRIGLYYNNHMCELFIHPSKEIIRHKNNRYKMSDIKKLAVEIYKELDMEMEALLWDITK